MKLTKLALSIFLGMSFSQLSLAKAEKVSGNVRLDGSSTVFPLAEALAEEFGAENPRVRVTVGLSGTGGGMKKFAAGEIDISNASRPMKSKERALAQKNNVKFMEIPLAYDGISVVLSHKNHFAKELSLADLKRIWEPNSKVSKWSDVNPAWPNHEIKLYGPGADSGTFDFFTEEVVGKARASRSDYISSEDDNVLVRGISEDEYAMGYFGYAYYLASKDKLNVVSIAKEGKNFVKPEFATIKDQSYALSRPLLVYVSLESAKRKEVQTFVEYLIQNSGKLASEVGYIPLPDAMYKKSLADFRAAVQTKQSH